MKKINRLPHEQVVARRRTAASARARRAAGRRRTSRAIGHTRPSASCPGCPAPAATSSAGRPAAARSTATTSRATRSATPRASAPARDARHRRRRVATTSRRGPDPAFARPGRRPRRPRAPSGPSGRGVVLSGPGSRRSSAGQRGRGRGEDRLDLERGRGRMGRPDPGRVARRCAAPRSCCRSRRSDRRPSRRRRRRARTRRTRPAAAGCRTRRPGSRTSWAATETTRREQRRIARHRDVVRGADEQDVREVGPVDEVVERRVHRLAPRRQAEVDDRGALLDRPLQAGREGEALARGCPTRGRGPTGS